jgi:hypothetical protein
MLVLVNRISRGSGRLVTNNVEEKAVISNPPIDPWTFSPPN